MEEMGVATGRGECSTGLGSNPNAPTLTEVI